MGVYFGKLRIGVELPPYETLRKTNHYEIRKYAPCVAAEVFVEQGNQFKGGDGFRPLAEYIGAFGKPNNIKKEAIKMTAPVITQSVEKKDEPSGEKIAMTAPVVSAKVQGGYWMQFIMPSKWTMETLPKPCSDKVKLKDIDTRYVAAMYFSGVSNDEIVRSKEEKLLAHLKEDGLKVVDGCKPELARYNDPFTPGFLRTNEIWVQIHEPEGK